MDTCRELPCETYCARLRVRQRVHLRHVATTAVMLRDDITHIRVCEMSIKIQPPKKTRRCLEATVNESFDGLEVFLVVREYRCAPAARERCTRNLALPKAPIEPPSCAKTQPF